MSNVTRLTDRAPRYDGLLCACGSAWFTLRRVDAGAFDPPGAVCLDRNRRVTGYTGCPVCVECGSPLPEGDPTT